MMCKISITINKSLLEINLALYLKSKSMNMYFRSFYAILQ